MYFSSSKDKNHILETTVFYGIIVQILDIGYVIFKVALFKCKWGFSNNGVKIDELGFTRSDLGKETYNIEPFIMATQAKQGFYVTDPADLSRRLSIVLKGKQIPHIDDENFDFFPLLLMQHKYLLRMKKLIKIMYTLFVIILKKAYGKINN